MRERAVRVILDNHGKHETGWATILSISTKTGCAPQTLNEWVKNAEVDRGERAGVTTEVVERLKVLERENREVKPANEILRKASASRFGPITELRSACVTLGVHQHLVGSRFRTKPSGIGRHGLAFSFLDLQFHLVDQAGATFRAVAILFAPELAISSRWCLIVASEVETTSVSDVSVIRGS